MNAIDLTPILEPLILSLGAVATVVLTWAGRKLAKWLGLKEDEARRLVLQDAIERAVNFGIGQLRGFTADKTSFQVKNAIIAHAVNYVVQATPDALVHFNITPDRLAELVASRLAERDPAAVPAGADAPAVSG